MKRLIQGFTLLAAGIGLVSSVGCGLDVTGTLTGSIDIHSVGVATDLSVHSYKGG